MDKYDISRFKIESKAKLGIQIQTGLLDKKFQKRTKRQKFFETWIYLSNENYKISCKQLIHINFHVFVLAIEFNASVSIIRYIVMHLLEAGR